MVKKRDERGQAVVEFVLILPVLILIVFGFMQIYLDIHAADTASQAARTAARMVSSEGYPDPLLVNQLVQRTDKGADVNITGNGNVSGGSGCGSSSTSYTITVSATAPNIVPFLGRFGAYIDPTVHEQAMAITHQNWSSGLNGPTSAESGQVPC